MSFHPCHKMIGVSRLSSLSPILECHLQQEHHQKAARPPTHVKMSLSPKPQVPDVYPAYDARFVSSPTAACKRASNTASPSRPFPGLEVLYNYPIPHVHGKSVTAVRVTLPPNGSTPPHTHPGAFVIGHVVSGYVFNARNDDPVEVKGPGESFTEHPGCVHRVSDNASEKEPAVLIATFVVDTKTADKGLEGLVLVEEKYRAPKEEGADAESGIGV